MADPIVKYSYISLLFLVFFSCALSDDSHPNVKIQDICAKHRNGSFCLAVLNSETNGAGSVSDLVALGQSTIDLARASATKTLNLIKTLMKEQMDDAKAQKYYTECSESYDDALEDLEEARQNLVSGDHNGANLAASAAMTNIDECDSEAHVCVRILGGKSVSALEDEGGDFGRENMEEAKGVVKHVLLAKFKDEIPQDKIDELIKGYANLVNLVPPMKSFHWGKDVSAENLHQGFTHVFESTFESTEGVAEYTAHPAHVEFANVFLASLEKVIVVDYKPTILRV
ncbi:hypothetical protein L6164_011928 [Bauhinia variegata]|uniref:Uncharacterized protein n=1 Tax=Bauhinia variegata TaxID=167791 RepID=A0ACB9P886_BAUVA|nr:hypothetical protein L6164_011928 [Bauhinia variegata]